MGKCSFFTWGCVILLLFETIVCATTTQLCRLNNEDSQNLENVIKVVCRNYNLNPSEIQNVINRIEKTNEKCIEGSNQYYRCKGNEYSLSSCIKITTDDVYKVKIDCEPKKLDGNIHNLDPIVDCKFHEIVVVLPKARYSISDDFQNIKVSKVGDGDNLEIVTITSDESSIIIRIDNPFDSLATNIQEHDQEDLLNFYLTIYNTDVKNNILTSPTERIEVNCYLKDKNSTEAPFKVQMPVSTNSIRSSFELELKIYFHTSDKFEETLLSPNYQLGDEVFFSVRTNELKNVRLYVKQCSANLKGSNDREIKLITNNKARKNVKIHSIWNSELRASFKTFMFINNSNNLQSMAEDHRHQGKHQDIKIQDINVRCYANSGFIKD